MLLNVGAGTQWASNVKGDTIITSTFWKQTGSDVGNRMWTGLYGTYSAGVVWLWRGGRIAPDENDALASESSEPSAANIIFSNSACTSMFRPDGDLHK